MRHVVYRRALHEVLLSHHLLTVHLHLAVTLLVAQTAVALLVAQTVAGLEFVADTILTSSKDFIDCRDPHGENQRCGECIRCDKEDDMWKQAETKCIWVQWFRDDDLSYSWPRKDPKIYA